MAKEGYAIPNETLPSLSYEVNLKDLNEFVVLVESLGIRISGTRIARYISYYEAVLEGRGNEEKIFEGIDGKRFDNPADTRLYVLREVHEIMWILKGLKKHIPKGAEKKLIQVVGGRDFAALDQDTLSRNTQFELRIASHFCQAGYSVDMSTLTDVVATDGENTYSVECKRVTSYAALLKRLRTARKQLMTKPSMLSSRNYGIIAVDVTKVAFKHNGLSFGITADHTKDIIQDKLKEIDGIIIRSGFHCDQKNLLMIWLQIHIPALVLYPNQYTTRFSSLTINNESSASNITAIYQLQRVIRVGYLIPDERMEPPRKLKRKSGLITLPKGTSVRWDEELLMRLLDSEKLDPMDPEDKILEMEIDGEKIEFAFLELSLLWANLNEERKLEFKKDRMLARFTIAGELMHLRSLFEPE